MQALCVGYNLFRLLPIIPFAPAVVRTAAYTELIKTQIAAPKSLAFRELIYLSRFASAFCTVSTRLSTFSAISFHYPALNFVMSLYCILIVIRLDLSRLLHRVLDSRSNLSAVNRRGLHVSSPDSIKSRLINRSRFISRVDFMAHYGLIICCDTSLSISCARILFLLFH